MKVKLTDILTTGATTGQAPVFDGTKLVYSTILAGISAKDNGTTVGGGPFSTVNFIGKSVIANGGSGQLNVNVAIGAQQDGVNLSGQPVHTLNFAGDGWTLGIVSGVLTIEHEGGGGGADHIPVVDGSFPAVFIQNLDGSLVLTEFTA